MTPLRALFVEAGYRVAFRVDVWTECLVSNEAERWLGCGDDEDAALADALERMFPSALARALLGDRLAARSVAPPSPADGAAEAEAEAVRVPSSQGAGEEEAVTEPPPLASPMQASLSGEAAPPDPPDPPLAAPSLLPAPTVERKTLGRPPALDERPALEALERLRADIERELPHLARLTPERQRLSVLVWICRARIFEDTLPGALVALTVQRIARRLTEISKMLWPGSVRALQRTTRPSKAVESSSAGRAAPATWAEAAERAEDLRREHILAATAAGLDEDGWADAAALKPEPPDPDALLARATADLETLLGPAGGASITGLDLEALLRIAQTLRWIRGSVRDDRAWGAAVGRLRRLPPAQDARGAALQRALDPAFRPGSPWATVVMTRPKDEVRADAAGELRAELAEIGSDGEALFAWLLRAFDVFSTPDLTEMLRSRREQVEALAEVAATHEDRRVRRRLRDLVLRFAPSDEGATLARAPLDAPPQPGAEEPDPDEGDLSTLGDRVRPYTQGRRVLFVSNRLDHELAARLTRLLGASITECEGTQRRVEAQCARLGKGSYDLVLSATGFQSHDTDILLMRAASGAQVPYVRVNRGRAAACVQAIAREFGLLSSTPNGGALRSAESGE